MKNYCYLGTRKGLFTLAQSSNGWEIVDSAFLGVPIPMVLTDRRNGRLYAVVEHGHFGTKLQCSEDGGKTWEEIGTPTYPEKPDDVPDIICPMRQVAIPWSLEKIWSLETGGDAYPDRLWCGTIPGGLFRSEDRGGSWELVRSLWDRPERAKWFGGGYDFPGIHSITVHPSRNDEISAAVSVGGVWQSSDSGDTWECRSDGMVADYLPPEQASDPASQDPHRMVQCLSNPDHFWIQHHCGIYRSTDNCGKWERIVNKEPSDFGFAVAVHPLDPATAWFVPAVKDENRIPVDGRLVVTRTSDGGKSFSTQSDGLPQENAYDLMYRHCLEIDPDGTNLMMGSTTGNIWSSVDQGATWTSVCHNLPPVYCVRFG